MKKDEKSLVIESNLKISIFRKIDKLVKKQIPEIFSYEHKGCGRWVIDDIKDNMHLVDKLTEILNKVITDFGGDYSWTWRWNPRDKNSKLCTSYYFEAKFHSWSSEVKDEQNELLDSLSTKGFKKHSEIETYTFNGVKKEITIDNYAFVGIN